MGTLPPLPAACCLLPISWACLSLLPGAGRELRCPSCLASHTGELSAFVLTAAPSEGVTQSLPLHVCSWRWEVGGSWSL